MEIRRRPKNRTSAAKLKAKDSVRLLTALTAWQNCWDLQLFSGQYPNKAG